MNKIFNFLNRYGVIIIIVLLLLIVMRNCSINSNMKKIEKRQNAMIENVSKKVDSIADNAVTETDLKIEGLKAEKRMIQSCDRKKFDLERENAIDKEIKELEKNKK